jgi:hypothetical protein
MGYMILNDLMVVTSEFRRIGKKLAGPAQVIALKWPHLVPFHFIEFNFVFIDQTLISKLVKDVIIKFLCVILLPFLCLCKSMFSWVFKNLKLFISV